MSVPTDPPHSHPRKFQCFMASKAKLNINNYFFSVPLSVIMAKLPLLPPLPPNLLLLILLLTTSLPFNAECSVEVKDGTDCAPPPPSNPVQTFYYSSPPPPPPSITLPPPPPCECGQGSSVPSPPGVMPYYPSYNNTPSSTSQFMTDSSPQQRKPLWVLLFLCVVLSAVLF